MTWNRHPPWEFESRNAMDDYVFGRYKLPREVARKVYRESRAHARIHGGSGRLIRNGIVVRSFSFFAENE